MTKLSSVSGCPVEGHCVRVVCGMLRHNRRTVVSLFSPLWKPEDVLSQVERQLASQQLPDRANQGRQVGLDILAAL